MNKDAALLLSASLHLALLIAAIWYRPHFEPLEVTERIVPIDVVDISELPTRVAPRAPQPEPAPEPPKQVDTPKPPEPAPAPPPAPQPRAIPAPTPPPLPDPVAQPRTPAPVEAPQPAAPMSLPRAATDLANLVVPRVNRRRPAEPQPEVAAQPSPFQDVMKRLEQPDTPPPETPEPPPPQQETPPDNRDVPIGEQVTDTEWSIFRQQISRNWYVDFGARDIDKLQVDLRVKVGSDKRVISVEVMNSRADLANPALSALAERSVRAVWQASAEEGGLRLPDDKSSQWGDMILHFRPQGIL
jgi:hypothetical protein